LYTITPVMEMTEIIKRKLEKKVNQDKTMEKDDLT
jgi:hypothetical protein